MLFNSYEFLFLFLPISLVVFFFLKKKELQNTSIFWLVGVSFFFYGWQHPFYLSIISGSIIFNYLTGITINFHKAKSCSKCILWVGILANIFLLGYFKYATFILNELSRFTETGFHDSTIVLPIAISFFTFQQIAFLVDTFRGDTREPNFLHYCLFVTFFPQLIAGPIVRHKEMMPQFLNPHHHLKMNYERLAVGLTIISIALFKKTVLADTIAAYASPVFLNAEISSDPITFFEAWGGILAYTFQLYFDFSAYSDMAIGIASLFGIHLPLNFHSPYKAKSIIEFWHCWHITLARFLRDYLYIPLGGSKKGFPRHIANLLITMFLAGLWHGAGWTFIFWGGLHGCFLAINHTWRKIRQKFAHDLTQPTQLGKLLAQAITFAAVSISWTFFRAESLRGSFKILSGAIGMNGIVADQRLHPILSFLEKTITFSGNSFGSFGSKGFSWIIILFLITFFTPNTHAFLHQYSPALLHNMKKFSGEKNILTWQPSLKYSILLGSMLFYSLANISGLSEFLYFNF